jgi:hypothetical protein
VFEVSVEVLDVVEHVDFFRVKDVLIFPPAVFAVVVVSDIDEGEFGLCIICPLPVTMLHGVPDRLIGVNIVPGADSWVKGNAVVLIVLLLFSILILKH